MVVEFRAVNPKHLVVLQQGVEVWNQWRQEQPYSPINLCGANLSNLNLSNAELSTANLSDGNLSSANLSSASLSSANLSNAFLIRADLSNALLSKADLSSANLSSANLSSANLSDAQLGSADLSGANLSGVNLNSVDLSRSDLNNANLTGANLSGADLNGVNLSRANLSNANLSGANLSRANLRYANLCGVDLSGANLSGVDLSDTNVKGANLREANLSRAQTLKANFAEAVLTAACVEDWKIDNTTFFDGAICDYVYLKAGRQERHPRSGTFQPGEFAALFQKASDTLDLVFKNGIDWQAFFQLFQELCSQYGDPHLSIQAIEKKTDGSFVVRLELSPKINKTVIENYVKELYETKLTQMEQRYRNVLNAKDSEIAAYRQQSANLVEIIKLQAARQPLTEGATG